MLEKRSRLPKSFSSHRDVRRAVGEMSVYRGHARNDGKRALCFRSGSGVPLDRPSVRIRTGIDVGQQDVLGWFRARLTKLHRTLNLVTHQTVNP